MVITETTKPSPENLREARRLATICFDRCVDRGKFSEQVLQEEFTAALQAKDDAAKAIREKFEAANEGEGDAYTHGWFEGRDAARAEPVNAPPQVLVLPEGGWCIERGDSESSKPKYWCGFVFGVNPLNHDGSPTKIKAVVNLWQLDNWMAVRFARKEDALRVRTCIENNEIDRATHRVAYHEWG